MIEVKTDLLPYEDESGFQFSIETKAKSQEDSEVSLIQGDVSITLSHNEWLLVKRNINLMFGQLADLGSLT